LLPAMARRRLKSEHLVDVVGRRSASFSLLDSSSLSRGWHSR